MTQSQSWLSSGYDRLNGLMRWWGPPGAVGSDGFETQFDRLQGLVEKLNGTFDDALRAQRETLTAANERFIGSLPHLMRARQPGALITAQLGIAEALIESVEAQTRIWIKLTQSRHDDCRAMACDLIEDAERETANTARNRPRPAAQKRTVETAGERAAHA